MLSIEDKEKQSDIFPIKSSLKTLNEIFIDGYIIFISHNSKLARLFRLQHLYAAEIKHKRAS